MRAGINYLMLRVGNPFTLNMVELEACASSVASSAALFRRNLEEEFSNELKASRDEFKASGARSAVRTRMCVVL